jgi:hypothetical protein
LKKSLTNRSQDSPVFNPLLVLQLMPVPTRLALCHPANHSSTPQARRVVWVYPRLLQLQPYAGKRTMRPLERKLLAQDKVKIVNRRYRVRVRPGF